MENFRRIPLLSKIKGKKMKENSDGNERKKIKFKLTLVEHVDMLFM